MAISGKEFMVLGVILLALVLVIGGAGSLAVGGGLPGGSDGTDKPLKDYACSGEVIVKTFGTHELAGVECTEKDPGLSCLLGWLDFGTGREGTVSMVVDGEIVATESWESSFGQNQDFTVNAKCVPEGEVIVNLYDEDGTKIDSKPGVQ